jgi:formate dehydrogenase major subunit
MIRLTIDGKEILTAEKSTILEAAGSAGIRIPTLCFHEKMNPIGSCRMCVVEVEGYLEPMTACDTRVIEGITVTTQSERLHRMRQETLKLLLANHPLDCPICEKAGECKLQDLVYEFGVSQVDYRLPPVKQPIAPYGTPMLQYWHSRCILCLRCVSACRELTGAHAIDLAKGENGPIISVNPGKCVSCGQCVQVCPVGALVEVKHNARWRPWDIKKVRTTCPYCGVGCQQLLHVKNDRIVSVTGVEDGAPNMGRLCVKGRFGYDFIYSEERLKTPLIRENGKFREASWDEALDLVADRFKKIIADHGPDALAGVSCARSINEDSYNMQKLFRAVFKTNNIDHCARVCHAPTVAGLAASFGEGAMTNSISEFSKARMFMVIGSNMLEAHPVAATFIKNAVTRGAELIVVDPRRHGLVDYATTHIQLKVGSDIAFLNALMQVLITEGLYDRKFVASCCTGFEELKEKVMAYPPERSSDICGIAPDVIRKLARRIAAVKPMMICYTLGITEHTCGKNNVMSIANLQMLLGNLGMECGGVNPLRGQNNVQGACDMGALPNVFPGYQKVVEEPMRRKFGAAWGVTHLPDKAGLMIPQMMDGLVTGRVRGFYIFGENLASTEADLHKVEHELASAEFLVCQDIFPTETTRFAHVVLPAAAWSEDDGTFANCERRVSRVRAVSPPPGIAKPNWWIFREIAKRFGQNWASGSAQEIWDNEISVLSPILSGISYSRIEGDGLQWPCTTADHPGTCFLHKDGQFTCGLGRLSSVDWTLPAEVPDSEYPFVLSTGRRLYHYHSRTQTGRCAGLNGLLGEETADISAEDARDLGISDTEMIRVASRRGEVIVKANVTPEVPRGVVWMAFHFQENNANWLTNSAFDPDTLTAEYKACAVSIQKLKN